MFCRDVPTRFVGCDAVSRTARVLVITFLESAATILIERGLYFYTHERLDFTGAENLGLALAWGVAYVVGAQLSHGVSRRLSEKRLLALTLVGQVLGHAVLCVWAGSLAVVAMTMAIGCVTGLKWPVVESYVAAGRTPTDQAKAIGRFNLSWAGSVPLALVAAGPLIAWRPQALFVAAAALSLVSLVLTWPLARRLVHLPHDHPERPSAGQMARLRGLLTSARWSMLTGYSLMWILAALLPGVFERLGVGVAWATALSGLLDVFRFLAFLTLGLYSGWHNRGGPLALVIIGLPAGFFMALFGGGLATVLCGELLFGAAIGMTYYAALYYAMVVKNAAVDAGGSHESLIGAGFAAGPASGLVGDWLAPVVGGAIVGRIVGVAPLVVVCAVGAAVSLVKVARARPAT